jgi:hypothetical protein
MNIILELSHQFIKMHNWDSMWNKIRKIKY